MKPALATAVLFFSAVTFLAAMIRPRRSSDISRRAAVSLALATSVAWGGLFTCSAIPESESLSLADRFNVGPVRLETSMPDYPVVRCGLPFRGVYGHNDHQWSRDRQISVVYTNEPDWRFSFEQGLWIAYGNATIFLVASFLILRRASPRALSTIAWLAGASLWAAAPASHWWILCNGTS